MVVNEARQDMIRTIVDDIRMKVASLQYQVDRVSQLHQNNTRDREIIDEAVSDISSLQAALNEVIKSTTPIVDA